MSICYQAFDVAFGTAACGDARALNEDEIYRLQASQMNRMRQADLSSLYYLQGLSQYCPPNQRPLDERFAEFKLRLERMVERHRKNYGG